MSFSPLVDGIFAYDSFIPKPIHFFLSFRRIKLTKSTFEGI